MRYAKLIDNSPIYAPNPIVHGGYRIGNPPPEIYLTDGYKPVQPTDYPEQQGIGHWEETWTETEDVIVQGWQWHEATDEDEISDAETVQMLMGGEGL